MFGRFTQHYTWQQIHDFLSVFGGAAESQGSLQRRVDDAR